MRIQSVIKHLRAVVFIAVIVGLVQLMDFMLVPSGYIRFILHEVRNPESVDAYGDDDSEDSFDVLILGASHGRSSFDPVILDEYGYSKNAFNLSIPGENVQDSYYLLMEADKYNDIKTVIFEMDYQYWSDYKEREFGDRFIYTWLPIGEAKIKYIFDGLLDKDFRTTYSKRWAYVTGKDDILKNISDKFDEKYKEYDITGFKVKDSGGPYKAKGFFYRNKGKIDTQDFWAYSFSRERVTPSVEKYFKKMVNYCKNNNIELICVTAPITPYTAVAGPSREANKYFAELCSSLDVEYIDYNLSDIYELPRTNEEFVDWEGHMCGELAERFSRSLAIELKARRDGDSNNRISFYKSYEEYEEILWEVGNMNITHKKK